MAHSTACERSRNICMGLHDSGRGPAQLHNRGELRPLFPIKANPMYCPAVLPTCTARERRYVNLNYMGFHKILKKHDKMLPHTPCRQFYISHLHNQPWVQVRRRCRGCCRPVRMHCGTRGPPLTCQPALPLTRLVLLTLTVRLPACLPSPLACFSCPPAGQLQ